MAENSIGALWEKESKKGGKFFSGKITIDGVTTAIIVFKNDYKKNDNHPDYQIYLANKQEKVAIPQSLKSEDIQPF